MPTPSEMQLQILPSYGIDEQKWNDCLNNSSNALVYAEPVYLNNMTENWDGIIADDYAAVMPVPWKKKLGIKYCYHVPFTQQLGVFGETVTENLVNECYELMLQFFKYGDYSFNYKNRFAKGKASANYTLSLASNYKSTSFFYDDKLKADLNKAGKNNLEYSIAKAGEAINLYHQLYGNRFAHLTENDYKNFYNLCLLKEKENNLVVRKVSSAQQVLAINLLLKDKHRLYNLLSCTTTEGRKLLAGHFLYDKIIQEFSQSGLVLDFEGSDIAGVAHFYKSFAAINQPYTKVHFNSLPKFLRLLKR